MKLDKLVEVNIREIWKHEQYDFSSWLSQKENIEELNKILGLTLVDIKKEAYVGSYRCDLVAKDETSDIKVIIENQLEQSNHDHLGKIITYASGLEANVIVWIVKEARQEHKAAIEWLNNNTNSDVNFFLIELHAYKIGDSNPAPYFKVIEEPNDYIKNTKSINQSGELNRSQSERFEFWERFNDVVKESGEPFDIRKATTNHWYDIAIGSSKCHIAVTLVNKENRIGVELYIGDNKELFDSIFANKESIEKECNLSFEWNRLDDKKASRIITYIKGLNFDNKTNYDYLMNEIVKYILVIKKVFIKYI